MQNKVALRTKLDIIKKKIILFYEKLYNIYIYILQPLLCSVCHSEVTND